MIGVIGSLVLAPGCTRNAVDDPDMHEPAGYFINLSGVAVPSTLYIYLGCNTQQSKINITALYNNGEPVINKKVDLIIEEIPTTSGTTLIGYFSGKKNSISVTTNSQGKVTVYYYVDDTDRERIVLEQEVNIRAYIETDLYPITYEVITVRVLSDYQG